MAAISRAALLREASLLAQIFSEVWLLRIIVVIAAVLVSLLSVDLLEALLTVNILARAGRIGAHSLVAAVVRAACLAILV